MLSSFFLLLKCEVEKFKFSLLSSHNTGRNVFLCKFRFNFSIGIFMANQINFIWLHISPCPLCVCKVWQLFGKFVSIPHDTLKNYVLKLYFQYLLAFQCKFHCCLYWLFVYSKLLDLLLKCLKCDEENFHSKCDNAFKLLERTFRFVYSSHHHSDLYQKANKTEETKF